MSSKQFALPPALDRLVAHIARAEGTTAEELIITAVATFAQARPSVRTAKLMSRRKAREAMLRVLAKVPNVPPMKGDEIPPDLAAKLTRKGGNGRRHLSKGR